jgi:type II secretory pathway component GspD/PulD (secretin)
MESTHPRSSPSVPDGHTIVVGGIQTVNETKNVDKVPLLGDIPLLSIAFKHTTSRRQYTNTYLFITPTIMKNTDFNDLQDASQQALGRVHQTTRSGDPNAAGGFTDPNQSDVGHE